MRFYNENHNYYCGVDLHARNMYTCVLDPRGEVLLHRDLPANPEAFLEAIAPYRDNLAVAAECMFTWYWLADLCAQEGIRFVLGHALYMKAIHGGKAKNDRIDSHKIATLLRGGMLPQAYVYPAEMRSTRDLLRRRLKLVRQRGELLAHIQNTHHQHNIPTPRVRINYKSHREGLADNFSDASVAESVASDVELASHYDRLIRELELYLNRNAKTHDPQTFYLLRSIPGVGKVLAMTILYEVHDISRFERVQNFASYARLVKCEKSSSGKRLGTGGSKIGNAHLKWAFSEAAVLFLRENPPAQRYVERLRKKHGKAKALSILAHKLGRAVYFMMKNRRAFSVEAFRMA